MVKNAWYAGIVLLLALGGAIGWATWTSAAQPVAEGDCPPGYARFVLVEPIQPGEQSSKSTDLGCKPIETSETSVLPPLQPGDAGWNVAPYRPAEQSPVVRGPSKETVYRCVVLLEPIRAGEEASRASEPLCSTGEIRAINGVSLDSSYLIAKFYDDTNYRTLLIEYYGASACSSTVSYGVTALPANLDNRFASGETFSNCNLLSVYDFANHEGPSYSCGPRCSSFHALNENVSSWRTSQ